MKLDLEAWSEVDVRPRAWARSRPTAAEHQGRLHGHAWRAAVRSRSRATRWRSTDDDEQTVHSGRAMSEFLPYGRTSRRATTRLSSARGFSWPMQRRPHRLDPAHQRRRTTSTGRCDRADDRAGRAASCVPQFGCRIWDLLFEPVTPNLLGLIAEAVRERSPSGSRGSSVEDVDPSPTSDDAALIRINITYRVKATNDRRNLVYPFYVIPHEDRIARPTMPLPAPESRRSQVPGHRRRGQAAHPAVLPGVDEPQRLRPRCRADRAVRLDERDGAVPRQPGARNGSTCTS